MSALIKLSFFQVHYFSKIIYFLNISKEPKRMTLLKINKTKRINFFLPKMAFNKNPEVFQSTDRPINGFCSALVLIKVGSSY